MKQLSILVTLLSLSLIGYSQSPLFLSGTSYNQNFDNLANGLPLGWRVDTAADNTAGLGDNAIAKYVANPTPWTTTSRGFYNYAAADASGITATSNSTDQGNATDRALGVKQVAAWDAASEQVAFDLLLANTTGLTAFSMSIKLQTFFQNSSRNNTWLVQYGLGANPTTFTTVTTVPASLYVDSNFTTTTVTVNFSSALNNQSQNVWIRLIPSGASQGSGNRPIVAIDDMQLSWTGNAAGNPKPSVVSLSPVNNATNVPITSDLIITFDKNITVGNGNILVKNITDASQQTIVVPTANVTTSGMTATIGGNTFLYAKKYAVLFDSTCFESGVYKSFGVYDSLSWTFTTENAPVPAQTALNETFTGCLDPQFGLFTEYSVQGTQDWRCSFFGHNDSNAVYMNGYTGGSSTDAEDWLISPKLDFSAMSNPYLHFWSKKRFTGSNTKQIFASSDYTGSGDPTLATWTNLNVNLSNLDTTWKQFLNADLSNFSSAPFYVAFKYVSTASGTSDEWSLDDIWVTDGPLAITSFTKAEFSAVILGDVQHDLQLLTQSSKGRAISAMVLDISGKTLATQHIDIQPGQSVHQLSLPTLASGFYFLQLTEDNKKTSLKFIIK